MFFVKKEIITIDSSTNPYIYQKINFYPYDYF